MMKASDAVAKLLLSNNITVGFELIGGMIAHLVDSIKELDEMTLTSLHHEQAAAFAAGGVARATNNREIGFALGTSGPGATNLITGIADCWLDNYPCIFITGQVNTSEQKGNRQIRQQGFQELDIVSLVDSITKYAVKIETADQILPEIQKAINIAKEGRPGPVLIDIPMDLQRLNINVNEPSILSMKKIEKINYSYYDSFETVNKLLVKSKKPLFIIGGGATSEDNFHCWINNLTERKIPFVASLKGAESVFYKPGYLGMIGAYGTRAANYAVQNADLIIVLGSRLDVRQTGSNVEDFGRNASNIVQIDIDPGQLNNRILTQLSIEARCGDYFDYFLKSKNLVNCADWFDSVSEHFKKTFVDEYKNNNLSPAKLMDCLSNQFNGLPVQYTADVGNHQMWIAHNLLLGEGQKCHHSGGLGAMGFSLPTAIGVQLTTGGLVVSISGDGGFQLNIQELDVINRESLPILMIILNNNSLGMVKNFQDMYFDGRNSTTYWNGFTCSFQSIGKAYGIESYQAGDMDDFNDLVESYVNNPRPILIEVIMKDVTSCKPRLTFGKNLDEQYPYDK